MESTARTRETANRTPNLVSGVVLLLVASSLVGAQTEFSVDEAKSKATGTILLRQIPKTVGGFDEAGRLVWTSSPTETWGYRYDEAGREVEMVDEHGDRNQRTYDSQGRIVEQNFFRIRSGRWKERYIKDAEGGVVALIVDSETPKLDVEEICRHLGLRIDQEAPLAQIDWNENENGRTVKIANHFARITAWEPRVPEGEDSRFLRVTTETLDRSLTIERKTEGRTVIITDDLGGWRREKSVAAVKIIEDRSGIIARLFRSEYDRILQLDLGERFFVRYVYKSVLLSKIKTKEIVDRGTGEVVFRYESAIPPNEESPRAHEVDRQPRPKATAFLPTHGPVAAWDSILYPHGAAVFSIHRNPYAFMPLEAGAALRRVVFLFDTLGPWQPELIEYTDDDIIFHLLTDVEEHGTGHRWMIFRIPRRLDSEQSIQQLW